MIGSVNLGAGSVPLAGNDVEGGAGAGAGGHADGVSIEGDGTALNPFRGKPSSAGNPGTMSAAHFVSMVGLADVYRWQIAQRATMIAAVPQLEEWGYFDAGTNPIGQAAAAVTAAANIEGGGMTASNGQIRTFGAPIFTTPKTGKGAIAFRARMLGPTAARENDLGISNATGSHDIYVEVFPTSHAFNYVLRADGGGTPIKVVSTVIADADDHDFVIAWNGTNVRLYIDGSLAATMTDLSQISDEPMVPAIFNTIAGDCILQRCLYGYIPT